MGYKTIFCRKEKHRNLFTGYGASIEMNPFFLFSFFLQKLFPSDGGEQLIVSRFFRKFNFCRLVSGSQPAMLSGSVSDSM